MYIHEYCYNLQPAMYVCIVNFRMIKWVKLLHNLFGKSCFCILPHKIIKCIFLLYFCLLFKVKRLFSLFHLENRLTEFLLSIFAITKEEFTMWCIYCQRMLHHFDFHNNCRCARYWSNWFLWLTLRFLIIFIFLVQKNTYK